MIIHSLINTSGQCDTESINLEKIISVKLLRVTALVLKFKNLLRTAEGRSQRKVAAEDMYTAERLWTKTIQLQCFPKDCKELVKNKKKLDLLDCAWTRSSQASSLKMCTMSKV